MGLQSMQLLGLVKNGFAIPNCFRTQNLNILFKSFLCGLANHDINEGCCLNHLQNFANGAFKTQKEQSLLSIGNFFETASSLNFKNQLKYN